MPNKITIAAAKKLEAKLFATNVPLAVFAIYGSWTVTKVTTESFKNQCRNTPDRLVGVYTSDIPLAHIIEDFHEANIR